MFSGKPIKRHDTLALRLTIWYAMIFALSSFFIFLTFYLSVGAYIDRRSNEEILEEIDEISEAYQSRGIELAKKEVSEEAESEDTRRMFFRLLKNDGSLIVGSDMSSWGNIDTNHTLLEKLKRRKEPVVETLKLPEKEFEVRMAYALIGDGYIVHGGMVLKDENKLMALFNRVFGVTMTIVVLLSALIGWFMARRALSGLQDLARTASRISAGAFEQRVPIMNRGREIEQLAITFNHMLDNIQKVILEMKQMSDNIAHDLKSPITRIRGNAEVTMMTGRRMEDFLRMAADTMEECDYLLEMINTMLDISETEAGAGKLSLTQVDLAEIVRDACDIFEPLLEKKGLELSLSAPETIPMKLDKKKIQRLIGNLLDNAIKYTSASGKIAIHLASDHNGGAVLTVSDTGIGISQEDLDHIFERFYRGDRSRSKIGSGLGLSLAMAIVKRHLGTIRVESRPARGSTFTITLPMQKQD